MIRRPPLAALALAVALWCCAQLALLAHGSDHLAAGDGGEAHCLICLAADAPGGPPAAPSALPVIAAAGALPPAPPAAPLPAVRLAAPARGPPAA